MPQINKEKYTTNERERESYEAAYFRLHIKFDMPAPDTEEFRNALDKELAAGFPIDWPGAAGNTLLHWAALSPPAARAGLPQILIDAGADIDVPNDYGHTPLGLTCWSYIDAGLPEYLTAIDVLLAAGARPKLDEDWKECLPGMGMGWEEPEKRARNDWLAVYLETWPGRRAKDRAQDTAPAFDYAL